MKTINTRPNTTRDLRAVRVIRDVDATSGWLVELWDSVTALWYEVAHAPSRVTARAIAERYHRPQRRLQVK